MNHMRDQRTDATADDSFGSAVRNARESAAMTQVQLADAMRERGFDFHQQTVYKIEAGRRKVTVGEALAIAELVAVPLDILAARNPDQNAKHALLLRQQSGRILSLVTELEAVAKEGRKHQFLLQELSADLDKRTAAEPPLLGGREQTYSDYYRPLFHHRIFKDVDDAAHDLLATTSLEDLFVDLRFIPDPEVIADDGEH